MLNSKKYWIERYKKGGDSGYGSYGKFCIFKNKILNNFVNEKNIQSVIELGCGDGNQLINSNYPKYIGYDISIDAINLCKSLFKNDNTKSFHLLEKKTIIPKAELTLSIDVLYHILEEDTYKNYLYNLFNSSEKYVILYSTNNNYTNNYHIKSRNFTKYCEEKFRNFKLIDKIENIYKEVGGSGADFYIYEKL